MTAPPALDTEDALAHVEAPIGWFTLNRPAQHNAINPAMFDAIHIAAQAWADNPDVRVMVLTGAGERAFASGADISNLTGSAAELPPGLSLLSSLAMPTVAMIRGWCIGGGLMTALSTDLRIAAESSVFSIPAGRLGVGYPLAATKRLVDVIGLAHATEILLTAERIDAARAKEIGLVHRVVPDDQLEDATRELATSLATNAPLTAAASKISIGAAVGDFADADALQAIKTCWTSDDYREGRAAFAEKRPPVFGGT